MPVVLETAIRLVLVELIHLSATLFTCRARHKYQQHALLMLAATGCS